MSHRKLIFLLIVSVFADLASGQIASSVRMTPYTRALLYPCANEGAVKTYLNLESGVDVQAYSANLDIFAGISPSGNVQSFLGLASYDGMQSTLEINDLVTLSGVNEGAPHLGTFTGATIPDNSTIKVGLQELETAVEGVAGGHAAVTLGADANVLLGLTTQEIGLDAQAMNLVFAGPAAGGAVDPTFRALVGNDIPDLSGTYHIDDLITLSGVAQGTVDLGTFTGATITDNSTVKTALQELETAVELGGGGPAGLLLAGFDARNGEAPSANFATLDTRNQIPVLDFDPAADESMVFATVMPPGYGGGGVTVTIGWTSTATTQEVVWDATFMSITDDADDVDTKSFAAVNSVTATTATAPGEVDYASISFTDGADMDSVVAGEWFRLKITRDADNANDDVPVDAELIFVKIVEN